MIKYITPIAAALLLSTGVANAKTTPNQAVTVCKAHLKANVEGFKRAKLGKIRSSRDTHMVTFAVSSDQGRVNTKCAVSRDSGEVVPQG